MIIKGSSRGGPKQLSRHLQRTDTNERVEILQLDSPTESLAEALRDWQLLAGGTRGSRGLYHANIDPDARYKMTPEQWQRAVVVLEQELGLAGQPRAIVMHEKNGRAHIHVVWQRTDIDTMTFVSDSNNYYAHERASLALEKEFGHEHVPGKHAKRDREKQPAPPKADFSHAEWQQGERAGIDPRAFKEAVTQLHQQCDTGQAFRTALEEKGYVLARGDSCDYVIVDGRGKIYNLARQINGVTAKDLRAFMADIDRETIPSAEQAKALQRERAQKELSAPEPEPAKPSSGPSPEELAKFEIALKARQEEEGRRLRDRQEAEYKQTAQVLEEEIADKLRNLDALQQAARECYERVHLAQPEGFAGFMAAIKAEINPERAAEEVRKQLEADAKFIHEQEKERQERSAALNAGRQADLADLVERHAQQQREHAARYDEDRARYAREHDAAERLRIEIEDHRRRQELDAEQQRARDGPEPPDRAR
jgi:Relaxase/Mobilisation nuclease domain